MQYNLKFDDGTRLQRSKITEEQKDILLKKFNDGMQSCSQASLGLRKEAAAETGLELNSVNVSDSRTSCITARSTNA